MRQLIGEITIDRIIETEQAGFDPRGFFPEVAAGDWATHGDWSHGRGWDATSATLVFTIQSFLIRTSSQTVIVDTCVGDHKERARAIWNKTSSGAYLGRLAAAGVTPEQVNFVVCTHLHADHVGWNTRLNAGLWVPTFPNAQYVMSEVEWVYWQERHARTPHSQIADSVIPVIESGQELMVGPREHEVVAGVWFEQAPGHTPGHRIVRIASGTDEAVITGDVMHSPVQCAQPGWSPRADHDPDLARRTRLRLLEEWSDREVLICATHFPSPSFGRIVRSGKAFRFRYEDETP